MTLSTGAPDFTIPKNGWFAAEVTDLSLTERSIPLIVPRYKTLTLSFLSNAFKTSFI